MKTLIISFLMIFGLNAQAMQVSPDQMTPENKAKLIEVLNNLEPEMLDAVLTEEAFAWYVEQFNRSEDTQKAQLDKVHGRIDLDSNPYEDQNAPTF